METTEKKELAKKILSRSTDSERIVVGEYIGSKVPERFNHLKYLCSQQGILGAILIADQEKVIQVIDVGVFQIVEI